MKYIPFTEFFEKNYLELESLIYTDNTLFKRIVCEELNPSEEDLAKLDVELSNPETAKKYLNNEEELTLLKTYKDNPNGTEGLDARNTLIENKLKYIHYLANKVARAGRIKTEQIPDAVQNAVLYLIKAIDKYDASKGVPFTAYSKHWILAGITNPFNPERQISISADTSGKGGSSVTSIDTPINTGGEDKEGTLGDTIADTRDGINPEEELNEKDKKALLAIFMKKLKDKEATAIKLWGTVKENGKKRTLEEIGDALGGMSKMGVKLLIDRTIKKLKKYAEEQGIVVG